jgi:hypothetical protein
MIFNSISKEIGNDQLRHAQYNRNEYQPSQSSYYPTKQSRLSNQEYMGARREEEGSAISQMNQKIMDNLEHLKYKDYARGSQLQGSRVSSRSGRSHHSHRSTHSIKYRPQVEVASHRRFYDIRTQEEEHYFPQKTTTTIKPEFSDWHRPNSNRLEHRHAYTLPSDSQQTR